MKKRLFATLMAICMLASLGTASFADVTGAEVEIDGGVEFPTLDVTVDTDASSLLLNPFGLEVTVGSDDITDQVISGVGSIKNESPVALKVDVKDMLGVTSDTKTFTLLATDTTATAKTKSAYLFMTVDAAETAFDNGAVFDADKSVVVSAKATPKVGIHTLGIGSDTATECFFAFGGSVVANPSPNLWDGTETVKITFEYVFTPVVVAD